MSHIQITFLQKLVDKFEYPSKIKIFLQLFDTTKDSGRLLASNVVTATYKRSFSYDTTGLIVTQDVKKVPFYFRIWPLYT